VKLAELLGFSSPQTAVLPRGAARTAKKVVALCHHLLSERGEVSGGRLAAEALDAYQALDDRGRRGFFELLIKEFSPDPEEVGLAGDAYRDDPSPENLARLQKVVEPPRQELFRRLNLAPDGTQILVAMRSLVLREPDRGVSLKPIAADLGHLFSAALTGAPPPSFSRS
jgi:malonyl-CoA decarboxylase